MALLLAAAPVATGPAQQDSLPAELRPLAAQLTPVITAGADTAQHYALLLPEGYPGNRPSPLLILMDPRGRALVPLARFAAAASRLGFVVMSSYNTLSDGAALPNVAAVNAMLADATRALRIDPTRIYLAGFSGTARMAYAFATELPGTIRGVIAAGAGPATARGPTAAALARDSAFVVFSTTATADFNHDEAIHWGRMLDSAGVAERTIVFDGGHQWMPTALATEALEWISWHHDRTRLDAGYPLRRLTAADSVLKGPDRMEAVRSLHQLARDFGGDSVVALLFRRPDALAVLKDGSTMAKREAQRIGEDRAWTIEADRRLEAIGPGTKVEDLARAVKLARLKEESEAPDPEVRHSARRRLEWLAANALFYAPRHFAETQAWQSMLVVLSLGRMIRPLDPGACRWAREAEGKVDAAVFRSYSREFACGAMPSVR